MKLKRITAPLKRKAKEVVKRIKEMPFESEPLLKKPGYIDLSAAQKAFAALGGIKGATTRAKRRVRRAAEDRLKHGLISPEAVNRLTQREVKKAVQKAETPLRQDINNAARNTVQSIKNTPQTLRTTATRAKETAKNIYENTGDITAKTAGWARKNPELFVGDVVIGLASKPAAFAINPALGAGLMASPVGPGKVATAGLYAFRKSPNKVVEYGGKKMTQRRKRILQGKKVERAVQEKIGGKSLKGGIESIKSGFKSLLSPINTQSVPSYKLARATM